MSVTAGILPAQAKPPLPTVLLYPASPSDVAAMVDLRTRLRLDGHFEALTYDAESASVKRVAAETSHPEWLMPGLLTDESRLALARALGMAFYVVVSPGREADGTHLQLVDTLPPALIFDWYGVNHQVGERAIESQAEAALAAHPVTVAADPPAPAPIVTPTIPEPPAAVPPSPVVMPEPSLSVAPPVTAPVTPTATLMPAPIDAPKPVLPASPATPPVAPPAPTLLVPAPTLLVPAPTLLVPAPTLPVVAPETPAAPPVVAPTPFVTSPAVSAPVLMPAPIDANSNALPRASLAIPVAPPAPTPLVQAPLPIPVTAPELPPAAPPVTTPAAPPMMAMLPPTIPSEPSPVRPIPKGDDLSAVSDLMIKGDAALEGGDVVGAISLFRQAINNVPLSVVPRLKLAQAYQRGGMADKALDEARRALEVAPDSLPVQQFLTQLDQENGTTDGSLTRYRALVERNPEDPAAHSGLAETLWNSGDLAGAEAEYQTAKKLSPSGDHSASAHLAQLYATESRYDDCLSALQDAGKDGYALAIRIVRNRSDALSSTLESTRDSFAAGRSTREQFYKDAQNVSAQAGALAGFVAKIIPPPEYKLSHLHRILSTNLLAQEAATLVSFIETGETGLSDSVASLDKEAQTEMLTAQAAEEKLGLWEAKK